MRHVWCNLVWDTSREVPARLRKTALSDATDAVSEATEPVGDPGSEELAP